MKANTAAEVARQRRCAAAGNGRKPAVDLLCKISRISRIRITDLGVGLDQRNIHHPGRNICESVCITKHWPADLPMSGNRTKASCNQSTALIDSRNVNAASYAVQARVTVGRHNSSDTIHMYIHFAID
eukprot:6204737-Pleurochrysis_carterae.AAC.2